MDMGAKIKELREQRGMTLEELGNKVGVGKSTVRKWETGMIANMKRDKISKVANALGVDPAYLMGWEDNLNKSSADLMVDMIHDTELLDRVHKINKLSADDKKTIYDMIDFLFEKAGF